MSRLVARSLVFLAVLLPLDVAATDPADPSPDPACRTRCEERASACRARAVVDGTDIDETVIGIDLEQCDEERDRCLADCPPAPEARSRVSRSGARRG